jgi:hypothetical protein
MSLGELYVELRFGIVEKRYTGKLVKTHHSWRPLKNAIPVMLGLFTQIRCGRKPSQAWLIPFPKSAPCEARLASLFTTITYTMHAANRQAPGATATLVHKQYVDGSREPPQQSTL